MASGCSVTFGAEMGGKETTAASWEILTGGGCFGPAIVDYGAIGGAGSFCAGDFCTGETFGEGSSFLAVNMMSSFLSISRSTSLPYDSMTASLSSWCFSSPAIGLSSSVAIGRSVSASSRFAVFFTACFY